MSVLSEHIEHNIDINVWYQQELLPTLIWYEDVWLEHTNPEQEMIRHMQEELSNEINKKILQQLFKENSIKKADMPDILPKNEYNGQQKVL